MKNLLIDYLEYNDEKSYNNVNIKRYNVIDCVCEVNFEYTDGSLFEHTQKIHLNLWKVLAFINNKI